jgi:hypothetical protein
MNIHPATFAHFVHRPALVDLHRAGLGNTQLATRMMREYGLAHLGNVLTPRHLIASAHYLGGIRQQGGKEGHAAHIVLGHLHRYVAKLAPGSAPPPNTPPLGRNALDGWPPAL